MLSRRAREVNDGNYGTLAHTPSTAGTSSAPAPPEAASPASPLQASAQPSSQPSSQSSLQQPQSSDPNCRDLKHQILALRLIANILARGSTATNTRVLGCWKRKAHGTSVHGEQELRDDELAEQLQQASSQEISRLKQLTAKQQADAETALKMAAQQLADTIKREQAAQEEIQRLKIEAERELSQLRQAAAVAEDTVMRGIESEVASETQIARLRAAAAQTEAAAQKQVIKIEAAAQKQIDHLHQQRTLSLQKEASAQAELRRARVAAAKQQEISQQLETFAEDEIEQLRKAIAQQQELINRRAEDQNEVRHSQSAALLSVALRDQNEMVPEDVKSVRHRADNQHESLRDMAQLRGRRLNRLVGNMNVVAMGRALSQWRISMLVAYRLLMEMELLSTLSAASRQVVRLLVTTLCCNSILQLLVHDAGRG